MRCLLYTSTGGNNASRCLIVQGPYTNIDKTVNDYTMPKDEVPDRLMVEVHFYDPVSYTHLDVYKRQTQH